MQLNEFINKWVCSDSFDMMRYQGRLVFQGLSCICYFPATSGALDKELVYAFSLPDISSDVLEDQFDHLDKLLSKTYGMEV